MLNRAARYLLAAMQAIIGWEWFVSGSNKVLSGTFPQGLVNILNNGIQNNPNAWYVSFLQNVVAPHSILFGYLTEWTEVTIGVALFAGAIILLVQPRVRGEPQHSLAVGISTFVTIIVAIGAFLCVNFHFYMGHGILPGINPSNFKDEGIDLDSLVPPFSIVIMIANIAYIRALRGETWYSRLYTRTKVGLRKFIGMEEPHSVEVEKAAVVSE